MSYEELGLNATEQDEIVARGIRGAIDDELEAAPPIVSELVADEGVKNIVDDMIRDFMELTEASEEEARLYLAEKILLMKKEKQV